MTDVAAADLRKLAEQSNAWPFEEAKKIVARLKKTPKDEVIFETGYGPSGLPHIGTFGEVARTSMVRHAFRVLTDDKIKTRLIAFSADSKHLYTLRPLRDIVEWNTLEGDFHVIQVQGAGLDHERARSIDVSADGQRFAQNRFRLGVFAARVKNDCQIVQPHRDVRVIRPVGLLVYRYETLVESLSLSIHVLAEVIGPCQLA